MHFRPGDGWGGVGVGGGGGKDVGRGLLGQGRAGTNGARAGTDPGAGWCDVEAVGRLDLVSALRHAPAPALARRRIPASTLCPPTPPAQAAHAAPCLDKVGDDCVEGRQRHAVGARQGGICSAGGRGRDMASSASHEAAPGMHAPAGGAASAVDAQTDRHGQRKAAHLSAQPARPR